MTTTSEDRAVKLALPKGRMHDRVVQLLRDAGVGVRPTARGYRPSVTLEGFEAKLLKPRAIVEMLEAGARDVGFAGADWVAESGADVVELLDTGFDPVRLVAAAPASVLENGELPRRRLVVASEYTALATRWIERLGLDASLLRSYGATEVLPPDDADCIVDNVSTGATLAANNLLEIDGLMSSSTRLYASPGALRDPWKRERIERFALLMEAVLEARKRAMLEVNVPGDALDAVIEVLPCMREPTVSPLHSSGGFAVKAAVPRDQLARVIPAVRQRGGTDIIVTNPEQIVP